LIAKIQQYTVTKYDKTEKNANCCSKSISLEHQKSLSEILGAQAETSDGLGKFCDKI
jgi:hypothetical protein